MNEFLFALNNLHLFVWTLESPTLLLPQNTSPVPDCDQNLVAAPAPIVHTDESPPGVSLPTTQVFISFLVSYFQHVAQANGINW